MFPVAAIGRALGITIYSALSCPTSAIPSSAPATPNPGDPWDGGWSVDEGAVAVRVGDAA